MKPIQRKGQSIIEFAVLIFIAVAAMLSMTVYVKRGLQGHWRSSADDLGSQYDAKHTFSDDMTTRRNSLQYTETSSVADGDVMRSTSKTTVVSDTVVRTGSEYIEPMGALWD